MATLPATLYVEGVALSGSPNDVEFLLRRFDDQGEPGCEDRVKVTVVRFELVAVGFESDHDLMLDNNTDYEPTGDPFGEPEWSPNANPPRNAPISHTMDECVDVQTIIAIEPFNLPSREFRIV